MWTWLITGRLLVVLFALSLMTACVAIHHPFYPDKWEARPSIAESVCTDIAGDYDVRGYNGNGNPGCFLLTQFFWSSFSPKRWYESRLDEVDHVKIEQNSDVIKITAWKEDAEIAYKVFRRQSKLDGTSYMCTPEGVKVEGAGLPVHTLAGAIFQKLTIFKLSDGSLVIKDTDTGGGLALVIPAFVSTSDWSRYTQYTGQSEKKRFELDPRQAKWQSDKIAGTYCPNADLGHTDAQLYIADVYYEGTPGHAADPVRAWVWYSLAAQHGDAQAADQLARVSTELTPEQFDEAKRQLALWKPGQCMQELTPDQKREDREDVDTKRFWKRFIPRW